VLTAHPSLQLSYRSGQDDLVGGFLVPCLERSVLYRRSAGYFSSAGLALAARGIASLMARGGKMRLVASPCLQPGDVERLTAAADEPGEVLRQIALRSLPEIEDALVQDTLNALAWMAASGRLEVKLAIREAEDGTIGRGIFHEKAGIFTDEDEPASHIAFSGSSNETAGGLLENFECVDAYPSWTEPERVRAKIEDFEALWNNTTSGLRVVEFSDVSKSLLERFRDPDHPPPGVPISSITREDPPEKFAIPPGRRPRDYQKDAIKAWSDGGGKGIWAMATGTGKTFTALTLAVKVAEKNRPFVIVVVCPFLNLCEQWLREMELFGLRPLSCFGDSKKWKSRFEEGYQRLALGMSGVHAIVTTNTTFQSEGFQSYLRPHVTAAKTHHLLIADEVHNLGAKAIAKVLPEGIQLRLGLSATPERHLDPEGTDAILGYFGGIVYEYGIQKAIASGFLCRYRYHPHLVELTDDEADEYAAISARLGPLLAGAEKGDHELKESAMGLLIRRARLLAGAENKLVVFDQVLKALPEKPTKALFYCGDGTTKDGISKEETRQIQAVSRLLGEKHGLRVRQFTFRESTAEREEILRDLSSGFLDGIVAIRCLDEGIDLPDLQMGFLLASSTNPRQHVQRRGRLLRPADGKRYAEIHDFVITPTEMPTDTDETLFNLERRLLHRELHRLNEFCQTADNGAEANAKLKRLRLATNQLSI